MKRASGAGPVQGLVTSGLRSGIRKGYNGEYSEHWRPLEFATELRENLQPRKPSAGDPSPSIMAFVLSFSYGCTLWMNERKRQQPFRNQMHGIVFSQLQEYVETKNSMSAWCNLLKHAQLQDRTYSSSAEYPDAEMEALLSAGAVMFGQPAPVVLEDFGVFIAPVLMAIYGHLIPREWKTLDVIAKADGTIHSVVREQNLGAKPPVLHTIRRSADEVVLIYGSPRKMCAFAIGIATGWQSTTTKPSKLHKPSACIMVRPTAKLCSAKNENQGRASYWICFLQP